jgi:hypothetical protein
MKSRAKKLKLKSRRRSPKTKRSPRRLRSPRLILKRSPYKLRGGEYKDVGINPETGGFFQYLFKMPTRFAAQVESTGAMIANAFKNTRI